MAAGSLCGQPAACRARVAALTRELATLIGAEIPVDEALRILSDQAASARMRAVGRQPACGRAQRRSACPRPCSATRVRFRLTMSASYARARSAARWARSLSELADLLERRLEIRGQRPVGPDLSADPGGRQPRDPRHRHHRPGAEHRIRLCRERAVAAACGAVPGRRAVAMAGAPDGRPRDGHRRHVRPSLPCGAPALRCCWTGSSSGLPVLGKVGCGPGDRPLCTHARHTAAGRRAAAAGVQLPPAR